MKCTDLDVRKNLLQDISALQGLSSLEYLYVSDNAAEDYDVFDGMHFIETDLPQN